MAKSPKTFFFIASTLCFLSFVGVTSGDMDDFDQFFVQGSVYCDTCRAQFVTRISNYLKDATVRLECRAREGGKVILSVEATTDATGKYNMTVSGDHEEEVCEIMLAKSPDPECSEVSHEDYLRNAAKISLTSNDGIATNETRLVNPLGFLRKTPLPECGNIFKELGIVPDMIV